MKNPVSWLTSGFARGLAATLALSFFAACGGAKGPSDAEKRRREFCKPAQGSEMGNLVLGFTPLQINKREYGGGGRLDIPATSDLDQVERFISYGVISGVKSAAELPKLEEMGDSPPDNIHELRANGYTVGNCYHCHNPSGLAFTKENGIQLELGPGKLFRFDTWDRLCFAKITTIITRRISPTIISTGVKADSHGSKIPASSESAEVFLTSRACKG